MATITIFTNTMTVVGDYNGIINYIESFPSWQALIAKVGPYFDHYVWIEVKS